MSDERRANKSVVIAEDESIIRMDLRETLEEEGYEVVGETGRGDEAVQLIRDLRPDVALLDVKMPGASGIEVARMVAEERLAAVVLLTAFSQRELVSEAGEAGVMAYLIKPFQKAELLPAIEIATARFEELKAVHEQAASLEERLEVRKVLDRAKGVLMDSASLSEQDAFSFLQRTAMNQRMSMAEVAKGVLNGSIVPPVAGEAAT